MSHILQTSWHNTLHSSWMLTLCYHHELGYQQKYYYQKEGFPRGPWSLLLLCPWISRHLGWDHCGPLSHSNPAVTTGTRFPASKHPLKKALIPYFLLHPPSLTHMTAWHNITPEKPFWEWQGKGRGEDEGLYWMLVSLRRTLVLLPSLHSLVMSRAAGGRITPNHSVTQRTGRENPDSFSLS